ncbi:MAG: spermine synthase [Methylococcales bacterium]
MQRFKGNIIYKCQDEEGIVEVVEDTHTRSLYFGTDSKQSSMSLVDPDRLELSYARAMMSCLLFMGEPRSILLVGLGGGSLAKFLLKVFPFCKIDVVELRESVANVAFAYFGLPKDSRLVVHMGDGSQFLQRLAHKKLAGEESLDYDLILLDAFDHAGMATTISGLAFFDACRYVLNPAGVLAINLWGSSRDVTEDVLDYLNHCFDDKILTLPVPKRGNIIGLALGRDVPTANFKRLRKKAVQLEQRMGIEFTAFWRDLKRMHSRFSWFKL